MSRAITPEAVTPSAIHRLVNRGLTTMKAAIATVTDVRSEEAINAAIEKTRARQTQLQARGQEVKAELDRLRRDYGNAIAEGADTAATPMPPRIRELGEEAEGVDRALAVIGERLAELETEAREANLAAKAEAAANAEREAVEAGNALRALIRSVGSGKLLPAADRYSAAMDAASKAEYAQRQASGTAGAFSASSVSSRVGSANQRALIFINSLRIFVAAGE